MSSLQGEGRPLDYTDQQLLPSIFKLKFHWSSVLSNLLNSLLYTKIFLNFKTQQNICVDAQLLQSCPTLQSYGPQPAKLLCLRYSQARILECTALSSSRGSSPSRNQIHVSCVSCIAGRFFTHCATWEVPSNQIGNQKTKKSFPTCQLRINRHCSYF